MKDEKKLQKRIALATKLKTLKPSDYNFVLGLDGFIDEIIHPVDKRMDCSNFTRINTIKEFGERIVAASGLSTNIEMFPVKSKMGGNGPLMSNAICSYGGNVTYIGALGYPACDPVYVEFTSRSTIYSIASSGHTDALEFDDGKLMLGKTAPLNDITWNRLVDVVGLSNLITLFNNTNLVGLVNWSMITNATDIFKNIVINVLPKLKFNDDYKPIFFFDLADPEKRENSDILELLMLFKEFNSKYRVVFGVNKKEAFEIASVLGLFDKESLENYSVPLEKLTKNIYDALGIYGVVVHPVECACCVIDNQFYVEEGPYTEKPILTTGAGDNFNAGFTLGLTMGISPSEALLLGTSTSGFYVRNAKSPQYEDVIQFLTEWGTNG